jgi:hypothetical protein
MWQASVIASVLHKHFLRENMGKPQEDKQSIRTLGRVSNIELSEYAADSVTIRPPSRPAVVPR